MKVHAIQCNKCGDKIYSRATHDMRWCTCESVAIDGGLDYVKISGTEYTKADVEVLTTVEKLYDDWNHGLDKFGKISYPKDIKTGENVLREST